jgi:actin-related protein
MTNREKAVETFKDSSFYSSFYESSNTARTFINKALQKAHQKLDKAQQKVDKAQQKVEKAQREIDTLIALVQEKTRQIKEETAGIYRFSYESMQESPTNRENHFFKIYLNATILEVKGTEKNTKFEVGEIISQLFIECIMNVNVKYY